MTLTRTCRGEEETMKLGEWLGRRLKGGETICLEGELGSGKTCFVRGLARGMGIDPAEISSPTFILCRRHAGRLSLAHVDAFRLSGPQDLDAIGWEELCGDERAVVAVEWPERIASRLPERRIEVALEHAAPDARIVRITVPDETGAAPRPRGPCPVCGNPTRDDAAAPFCSARCRMVDLGRWMSGQYTL